MSTIITAGAGHGGIVAAMLLARAGHEVTVFEKNSADNVGLEQKDSLDATALDYAGIDIPEEFKAPANVITFVPLEDDVEPVTLPAPEKYRNLTVDRKEFLRYLTHLAQEAGVRFVYGAEVLSPIMLGSRVAGLRTSEGDFYADLIIDSAGVHSPVRNNLPEFLGIDGEPEYYDILHTYRAYFDRLPGVDAPDNPYNIYVKEDGTKGFRWAITEQDRVDVLLVRFPIIEYTDVAQGLYAVSGFNPHMDKNISRGGHFADIPVRQPAALLVADGYAMVGDSAFMTYPVKGSGMAYAIRAGKILADAVLEDELGLYNSETLWEYERRFFREIGFSASRLAILKAIMPYMTASEINEIFKRGIVSTQELQQIAAGEVSKAKMFSMVREKLKIMGDIPDFKEHMADLLAWMGRFTAIEPTFPNKYSRENALKWAQRYNRFFDSIRKKDEETQ